MPATEDDLASIEGALESLIEDAQYNEIWGVHLNSTEEDNNAAIKFVLKKVLLHPSLHFYPQFLTESIEFLEATPTLYRQPACQHRLKETLKWRRKEILKLPMESKQPDAVGDFCSYTLSIGPKRQPILWTMLNEVALTRYGEIFGHGIATTMRTILIALEATIARVFKDLRSGAIDDIATICVLGFVPLKSKAPEILKQSEQLRYRTFEGFQYTLPHLLRHYPKLLERLYLIGVPVNYILDLELPNDVANKVTILDSTLQLKELFSEDCIPSTFGGSCKNTGLDPRPYQHIPPASSEPTVETPKAGNPPPDEETRTGFKWESENMVRNAYSKYVGPPTLEITWEPGMPQAGVWRYDDILVKYRGRVTLAEAEAMVYVARNTTIPVPKVESAHIQDGQGYIFMEYVEGEALRDVWGGLEAAQKESIILQLKDYVSQLRSLKPESYFIGPHDRTHCQAPMFQHFWGDSGIRYGPFHSEAEFNEGIVKALGDRFPPYNRPAPGEVVPKDYIIAQTVRSLKGHDSVYSHGDLHGHNIRVRDGKIVAIIDWGEAGFWPEYWEFCRAHFLTDFAEDWMRSIDKWCPTYYLEMKVMEAVYARLYLSV